MDEFVLLQVSLSRFERRQFGGAVREQIILDATHALSRGENIFPWDIAFAERRGVAVRVGRTFGEQQAVVFAGVLPDEGHDVRAGADGNVYVGVELQVLRLGQNINRPADSVASALKLDGVVM